MIYEEPNTGLRIVVTERRENSDREYVTGTRKSVNVQSWLESESGQPCTPIDGRLQRVLVHTGNVGGVEVVRVK